MILRRLSQSLKQQNWTAIWIEFILLIAGVFLGIQVANWNEAQQDIKRESEFIARLDRDFQKIDARLADNISKWEEITTAQLHVLEDLNGYKQQGSWTRPKSEILQDLNKIFNSRIPAPRSATYVELLSAGQLGLLRDSKLRDVLLEYDMQVGYSQTAYNILVQRAEPQMATIVPHLEFDRNKNADIDSLDVQNDIVWIDVDLVELAADPKLKVALNMYASASRNQLFVIKLQQEKALAVLKLLNKNAKRMGEK
jgi:hypothetical protein